MLSRIVAGQRFRRVPDLLYLVCALIATRVAFRSRYLYDIDSVNFALGLRRFDPATHQPHPPGYFLYVMLGRLVDRAAGNANTAFVGISVLASCGALCFIWLLADRWFGKRPALFAGMIFLFSPLVWFHGTVALVYAVEAFFSSLAGYLCWRIVTGSAGMVVPLAVVTGLAAGFRPSFLLFIFPLLCFAMRRISAGRIAGAVCVFLLTLCCWALPMIWRSGGPGAYLSALFSLWNAVPGKSTVANSSFANSVARIVSVAAAGMLCFGSAVPLALQKAEAGERSRKVFTWAWIGPGLLFFCFVFLKFVNAGYLLVISPPLFVWLGQRGSEWYESARLRRAAKFGIVVLAAAINTTVFLFAPVYCSYASVRGFEAELKSVLNALPAAASPADTMIVGFDSHFLGYRHAGYYLPGWLTVQYPEVRLAAGPRVFAMEHGDTELLSRLPPSNISKFIFLPLPSGDTEYRAYASKIYGLFRPGRLHTVHAGGREFIAGDTSDLRVLFPSSARAVSTPGDTPAGAVSHR